METPVTTLHFVDRLKRVQRRATKMIEELGNLPSKGRLRAGLLYPGEEKS